MPVVIGGLGEKKSNGGSQYFQQDRVYTSDGIAMCHPANIPGGSYRYLIEEVYIIDDLYANREARIYTESPTLRSERFGLKVAEKYFNKTN